MSSTSPQPEHSYDIIEYPRRYMPFSAPENQNPGVSFPHILNKKQLWACLQPPDKPKLILCRSTTISVVELQGVSQGNSDSGSERLRLPTASLTIVFYSCSQD